jgi:hypothetical protein
MEMPDFVAQHRPHHPHRPRRASLLIVMLALVTLSVGLGVTFAASPASHPTIYAICGELSLTRRGLPCDIPLPDGASFDHSVTLTQQGDAVGVESAWVYNIPQDWQAIIDYYLTTSRTQGWSCAIVVNVADVLIGLANKVDRPGQNVMITFPAGDPEFIRHTYPPQTEIEITLLRGKYVSSLCAGWH